MPRIVYSYVSVLVQISFGLKIFKTEFPLSQIVINIRQNKIKLKFS